MINYIVQVILFQALFLAVYDFFLQKETFFKWNRFYLLITPLLSFIIPLLKFESIQKTIPQEYIVQLPTVFLNPQAFIEQSNPTNLVLDFIAITFYIGLGLFTLLFLIRLSKIFQLIASNTIIKKQDYSLVLLEKKQSAFSFFKYIFINEHLLKSKDLQIIKHELIHCKQNHTIDLLFFELLKIVLWFNPLVYVYQKRITLLHEYISDAEIVLKTDKKNYFNRLLAETFNVENISFINQFFKHSLIKKRIVMITKEKSKKMKQLKYLLIVPLSLAMLIYVSCSNDAQIDIDEIKTISQSEEIQSSEGKYFSSDFGKIYVGDEIVGKIVPYNDMTNREKKLFDKIDPKRDSNGKLQLVIDSNGNRVLFIKVDKKNKTKLDVEYYENGNVPFAIIEEVPIYPGCEGTKEELKLCLQEKITKHVNRNFNTDLGKNLGLSSGIKRIFVMFKINKEGNITDVKSRAPHKALQEEAIRVVKLLPEMSPGKQKGETVDVMYSLPIAFKVE
jgi:bla regulator protein blaR1